MILFILLTDWAVLVNLREERFLFVLDRFIESPVSWAYGIEVAISLQAIACG